MIGVHIQGEHAVLVLQERFFKGSESVETKARNKSQTELHEFGYK